MVSWLLLGKRKDPRDQERYSYYRSWQVCEDIIVLDTTIRSTNTTMSMATRALHLCHKAASHSRGSIGTKALDIGENSRRFSSYVLDGFGRGGGGGHGGIPGSWPVTKANTIFNIVPQGHKFVVERFGKLHSVEESGWFLAIPLVDQIAYVIDVRERAIDIEPQAAITRDNVSVEVSGNLFVKFQDPEKAAYGALNPLYSVTQVNIHFT